MTLVLAAKNLGTPGRVIMILAPALTRKTMNLIMTMIIMTMTGAALKILLG